MKEEATPDSLMEQFKGRGLKPIVMFTLIVHVVVILGSSVPFFVKKAFARGNSKRTETERIENAVEDATAALRKIAKKHGLNPQDISDQFSGKSRPGKAPAADPAASADEPTGTEDAAAAPDTREKSAYETNLEAKAEGPKVPDFEDDKDDIF